MKQDKEAITEILSAIAKAQLALSAAERAFQEMVKSMPIIEHTEDFRCVIDGKLYEITVREVGKEAKP